VILAENDVYEHLGVPTSFYTAESAKKAMEKMARHLEK
jgi:hypothetical protein